MFELAPHPARLLGGQGDQWRRLGGLAGALYGRRGRWARAPFATAREQRRFAAAVEAAGRDLEGLVDSASVARDLAVQLGARGFRSGLVERAFALVRTSAERVLGQRHFDTQLVCGRILLGGGLAEMETGEGKTLAATLPAATAALARVPVHVVTVNDYLTQRDADAMRPVYESLGLRVGVITSGLDAGSRRAAYACDITYCTNKELAFDYLKDRMLLRNERSLRRLAVESLHAATPRLSQRLQRGLFFAIVDEADSVLIDEARTPLVISGSGGADEAEVLEQALALARELLEGRDYAIDRAESRIELTDAARALLDRAGAELGGLWAGRMRREELIRQALIALHLFHRDHHYLVRDGAVFVVDEYTGRVMPDRSWTRGLQQLIEAKEDCALSRTRQPLARMSYQRFFRRYAHLSGMTGTAREVARELRSVYGLGVRRVPRRRPLRSTRLSPRIAAGAGDKWRAIAEVARERQRALQPVLIGTRSVAASELASAALRKRGVSHQLLNASQDKDEAAIIARAGEAGSVTVATNMAGRGTDIRLGDGAAAAGGLHVILSERHDARRIDRQLAGRCGRQGDPGVFEEILSLEDELLDRQGGPLLAWLRRGGVNSALRTALARWLLFRGQRRVEAEYRQVRRRLMEVDERLEDTLAFSGHLE